MIWLAFSVLTASLLAGRGYAKQSLSLSGALAALAVGSIHMACGCPYGLTLILFYMTASRLTKVGGKAKAALEEHYSEGGRRTATQARAPPRLLSTPCPEVLANSLAGAVLAAAACAADAGALPVEAPAAWRAALHGAFLGHYACCCADTWSSELGVLSSAPPRLIINWWRRVPRGTNGGVSALGLKAGAAGGALMGAAFWLTGGDPGFRDLAGHPGIAASAVGGAPVPGLLGLGTGARGRGLGWLLAAAALGAALGTLGTLLDSLLGATLQARHLLPTTLPPHYSGVHTASGAVASAPGPGVAHVCGLRVLSNSGVNMLSAAATALAGGAVGLLLRGAV